MYRARYCSFFFFFNDPATTEIYTLSLHDALPISTRWAACAVICPPLSPSPIRAACHRLGRTIGTTPSCPPSDRKSTRLNSSHSQISYAVFCLKKKKKHNNNYMKFSPYLVHHCTTT